MDEDREIIERRIAEAKRSMSTRLAVLGDRLDRTRNALSLRQQLEDRPWAVLGASAVLGLVLGHRGATARRSLPVATVSAGGGLLGFVIKQVVRSLVTTVAAAAAAKYVQRHEGSLDGSLGHLADPELQRTSVRVYPLT